MAPTEPMVDSSLHTPQRRVVKYLNNKDLLAQVRLSKAQSKMTNTLATMLQLLCAKYAKKGSFAGYSYNEDMQAYAMLMIVKTWKSFDETKSNNPFAFYTQCIKNSFIQFLNQEKRQRDIRDNLLIDNGMNPSLNMQMRGDDGDYMTSDDFDYSTPGFQAAGEVTEIIPAPVTSITVAVEEVIPDEPEVDVKPAKVAKKPKVKKTVNKKKVAKNVDNSRSVKPARNAKKSARKVKGHKSKVVPARTGKKKVKASVR